MRETRSGDATLLHAHVAAERVGVERAAVRDEEDLREGARQLAMGQRVDQPSRALVVEGAQRLVEEKEAWRHPGVLGQRRQREGEPQRQRDLITRATGE